MKLFSLCFILGIATANTGGYGPQPSQLHFGSSTEQQDGYRSFLPPPQRTPINNPVIPPLQPSPQQNYNPGIHRQNSYVPGVPQPQQQTYGPLMHEQHSGSTIVRQHRQQHPLRFQSNGPAPTYQHSVPQINHRPAFPQQGVPFQQQNYGNPPPQQAPFQQQNYGNPQPQQHEPFRQKTYGNPPPQKQQPQLFHGGNQQTPPALSSYNHRVSVAAGNKQQTPPTPSSYGHSASLPGYSSGIQANGRHIVPIRNFEQHIRGSKENNYDFQAGNGISQSDSTKSTGNNGLQKQGSYSYTSPEGVPISLNWTADSNGFKPEGSHLPTPPPIPAEIAATMHLHQPKPKQAYRPALVHGPPAVDKVQPHGQALSLPLRQSVLPTSSSGIQAIVPIRNFEQHIRGSEENNYEFQAGNGISQSDSTKSTGNNGLQKQGSYSYTSPEGVPITLNWAADSNGFKPEGSHLPTAPPIPAEIAATMHLHQPKPSASNQPGPSPLTQSMSAPSWPVKRDGKSASEKPHNQTLASTQYVFVPPSHVVPTPVQPAAASAIPYGRSVSSAPIVITPSNSDQGASPVHGNSSPSAYSQTESPQSDQPAPVVHDTPASSAYDEPESPHSVQPAPTLYGRPPPSSSSQPPQRVYAPSVAASNRPAPSNYSASLKPNIQLTSLPESSTTQTKSSSAFLSRRRGSSDRAGRSYNLDTPVAMAYTSEKEGNVGC